MQNKKALTTTLTMLLVAMFGIIIGFTLQIIAPSVENDTLYVVGGSITTASWVTGIIADAILMSVLFSEKRRIYGVAIFVLGTFTFFIWPYFVAIKKLEIEEKKEVKTTRKHKSKK